MSFTFFTYYFISLFGATIYAFNNDFSLGWRHLIFFFVNVFWLSLFKKDKYSRIAILISLGTVFLSHFLRSLIIYGYPELYGFAHQYPISGNTYILNSLEQVCILVSIIITGIVLPKAFFPRTKIDTSTVIDKSKKLLRANFLLIILLLLGLLFLQLYLYFIENVGAKGVKSGSPFAFLLRLIPMDFPFVLITLFLLKYKKELQIYKKLILISLGIGFSFALLVTGSKAFIMIFGLSFIVYQIYENRKLHIVRFIFLIGLSLVLTVGSFLIANAIKHMYIVKGGSISDILNYSYSISQELETRVILSDITGRFIGLDGDIVFERILERGDQFAIKGMETTFSPMNIVYRILEGMIPFVDLTKSLFSGVAVSYYIQHFPLNKPIAGSIGMFASVQYISANFYPLVLLFIGLTYGFFIQLTIRIKDPDLKFIIYFFTVFFILHNSISGNVDILYAKYFMKCILTIGYVYLILLVRDIIKRGVQYEK